MRCGEYVVGSSRNSRVSALRLSNPNGAISFACQNICEKHQVLHNTEDRGKAHHHESLGEICGAVRPPQKRASSLRARER